MFFFNVKFNIYLGERFLVVVGGFWCGVKNSDEMLEDGNLGGSCENVGSSGVETKRRNLTLPPRSITSPQKLQYARCAGLFCPHFVQMFSAPLESGGDGASL